MLSELSARIVPLDFSNELEPIPTAAFPSARAAARSKDEMEVRIGAAGASADDTHDSSADTLVWEFEAGKQLAVMTLNAPLSAIRKLGHQHGASIVLRTRQDEAVVPLVQVKAAEGRKRKRDEHEEGRRD